MAEPVLELSSLSISVADRLVLDRLTIEVGEGRVLGVFGDSGVGKTSLLHTIAGLANAPFVIEGDIRLDGSSIVGSDAADRSLRGVSIVLQDLALFRDRSTWENLAYPLRRRRWEKSRIERTVEAFIDQFGLTGLGGRRPEELSGGQRQRVAFARALIYKPRLLLLDEPLRGLQDDLRYELLAMLRQLASAGTAMVVVSHDREEVALISDRILCLRGSDFAIEERDLDGAFASLGECGPRLSDGRNLDFELLRPLCAREEESGGEKVQIFEVRRTPHGAWRAMISVNDGTATWALCSGTSAPRPGRYFIAPPSPPVNLEYDQ